MELNANKLALAAALTASFVYILCAIFVVILPDFSAKLLGWLIHSLDVKQPNVTLVGAIIGLSEVFIYTFAVIWVFARIYNWLMKAKV